MRSPCTATRESLRTAMRTRRAKNNEWKKEYRRWLCTTPRMGLVHCRACCFQFLPSLWHFFPSLHWFPGCLSLMHIRAHSSGPWTGLRGERCQGSVRQSVCIYLYKHTCVCVYMYIYKRIYIYMYVCVGEFYMPMIVFNAGRYRGQFML